MAKRRGFGALRKLPSGRYQASYIGPDGVRRNAGQTFEAEIDAEEWLAARRREITSDDWEPPKRTKALTFGEYAERWLERRTLKPRTRYLYRKTLDARILPTFANMPLKRISAESVGEWHHRQGEDKPTARSQAYSLLRTILGDAVKDRLIEYNPCHIRGASNVKRKKQIEPATLEELATIAEHMPERLRLMVMLAAWCAMRFGELAELRRRDIDIKNGVVKVRRAVTWVDGEAIVGTPKTSAGVRDIHIPDRLMPLVKEHLHGNITGGKDGLLFPSAQDPNRHMFSASMYKTFRRARRIAGRPDLRFHDLRHTGAVLAAQSGATLAELMNRLGHSTAGAAMRYQHASAERDKAIADKLSQLMEAER